MKRLKDAYFTNPILSKAVASRTLTEWLISNLKIRFPFLIIPPTYEFPEILSICFPQKKVLSTLIDLIKDVSICDPSCGDGNLLLAAADQLYNWWNILDYEFIDKMGFSLKLKYKIDINSTKNWIIQYNLYGVDFQNSVVKQCKINLLNWADISSENESFSLNIVQGDSLLGKLWNIDFKESEFLSDLKQKISSKKIPDSIWNKLKPFHWGLNFPEIFHKHGFDIIIGNPPWNAVKPFEKEFFAKYDSRLTRYNVDKKEAKIIIKQLIKDPSIEKEWLSYSQLIQLESYLYKMLFLHQSAEIMGKNLSADINYYKLFLERVYYLTNPYGVITFLVPSGFYSDAGAKGLRELYFEKASVREIINFENREGIFSDIHRSFKFIFLLASKQESPTITFKAQFMLRDLNYFMHYKPPLLEIEWNLLKKLSPESISVIEFHDETDIQIVKKMLDSHPLLLENHPQIGNVRFRREFDMSLDSDLFSTVPNGLPLWEGKMIEEHTPYFTNCNRYYVDEKIAIKKLYSENELESDNLDHNYVRLGFRAVAASTNRRSMIASLIPPRTFCGNSIIVLKRFENGKELLTLNQLLYLCGVFNSMIFDYLVRLKINTNLNMFFIYQMPIPIASPETQLAIINRVLKLTENWDAFEKIRSEFNINGKKLSKMERLTLMSEIDVFVGKIYQLNHEEMQHILAQFHQCNEDQEKILRKRESLILTQF